MEKVICSICNIREVLLVPDKTLPSVRYDWKDDSDNKRMNVLYPLKNSNACYLCSKKDFAHGCEISLPLIKRRKDYGNNKS